MNERIERIASAVRSAVGRPRFATGGTLPRRLADDDDSIPAILSPGRSTTLRPGESLLEATERLYRGEDL